jgi:hypothetical protein
MIAGARHSFPEESAEMDFRKMQHVQALPALAAERRRRRSRHALTKAFRFARRIYLMKMESLASLKGASHENTTKPNSERDMSTCDQTTFERDTSTHALRVLRDDGVNRHIKFRRPESSAYWFEILTWCGALCIRGDMGTYVFSRLDDMFEFFRTADRGDPTKLYINKSYWMEKVQSVACSGGKGSATNFDADKFRARVTEHFNEYCDSHEVDAQYRADMWSVIESDVLLCARDGDSSAFTRLMEFHDKRHPHIFESCYEWNCNEYDFQFVWCLYAIAWAIRRYDASLAAIAEAAISAEGRDAT